MFLSNSFCSQPRLSILSDLLRKNKNGSTREWCHRDLSAFSFVQGRNVPSKNRTHASWNTGIWAKKLERLAKSLMLCEGKQSVQRRAQYVLDMRRRQQGGIAPTKGMAFFKFEEDLEHHIREAMVICTSGVPTSFFDNPYVRDLLQNLQPQHRPIYRMKLGRIIMVIDEIIREEVSFSSFQFVFDTPPSKPTAVAPLLI